MYKHFRHKNLHKQKILMKFLTQLVNHNESATLQNTHQSKNSLNYWCFPTGYILSPEQKVFANTDIRCLCTNECNLSLCGCDLHVLISAKDTQGKLCRRFNLLLIIYWRFSYQNVTFFPDKRSRTGRRCYSYYDV